VQRGIHHISDREYFAIDLPSSSTTKPLLTGTNAHLAHRLDNPPEESDAFTVGAMVHAMCLTPETVDTAFVRVGKIDRRTKEGKERWDELEARAVRNGARLISDEQYAVAQAMADAVKAHPTWIRLSNLIAHREVAAIGDVSGKPAKCKVDAADEAFTIIIDLKTTQSAAPSDFARSAATFGYAHQAAWYRAVLESLGRTVNDFVFVCVEKNPPHLVATYRLADSAIDAAAKRLPELVTRWNAVRDGDRTGYPSIVTDIDLPSWAYSNLERNATDE